VIFPAALFPGFPFPTGLFPGIPSLNGVVFNKYVKALTTYILTTRRFIPLQHFIKRFPWRSQIEYLLQFLCQIMFWYSLARTLSLCHFTSFRTFLLATSISSLNESSRTASAVIPAWYNRKQCNSKTTKILYTTTKKSGDSWHAMKGLFSSQMKTCRDQ